MKRLFSFMLAAVLVMSSLVPAFALNENYRIQKESLLSALYEADISAVREAVITGVISCSELTEYYLGRIKEYNKPYNCFITLCDDALSQAKERDEQLARGECDGLLFGVPVVIKDNMNLEGYYTTNGHRTDELERATDTAKAVEYMLEQGAVIIGKTNMSTDAQDARTSYSKIAGETKNAYNILLAPGGSSGGTAAAVSLNFAVAGLGTDTNSSLRIPAVLNGCVALRPTLKKVPFEGCTHLNNSRDTVGAITRSVYDQAIMLDVLTDGQYSYTKNLDKDALKGLKLGILKEFTEPFDESLIKEEDPERRKKIIDRFDIKYRTAENIDTEVMTAFYDAVEELKSCGATVTEISMPDIFEKAYPTFEKHTSPYKDEFYGQIKSLMENADIDVIIFPTYISAPLKSGTDESGKAWNVWSQAFLNNCRVISSSTKMPEISIPIGNHSRGAGMGLQITALRDCEQLLLDIAYTYTLKYDHRTAPDGAPDKYADFNDGTLGELVDRFVISANAQDVTEPETEEFTLEAEEQSEIVTETNENPSEDNRDDNPILPVIIAVLAVGVVTCAIIIIIKKKQT